MTGVGAGEEPTGGVVELSADGLGVGAVTGSGDGVTSVVSSSSASIRRFSYQTTRSWVREADNRSRSPSPSRSTAIT